MVWINSHQPVRRGRRLRRLPRERLRARGRPRRAVRVRQAAWTQADRSQDDEIYGGDAQPAISCGATATARRRANSRAHHASTPPIDRTPKLYIGGKQARPGLGLQPRRCTTPRGRPDRRGGRRQPQGHPQRRRGGARRGQAGPGRPAHNRAQILYYIAENLSARADEFAAAICAHDRPRADAAAQRGRGGDRAAVHLRRLGRQVRRRGAQHADPQRHAGDARADRRDRHRLPGRVPAARLRLAASRRRSRMGNTVVLVPSERYPLRRPTSTRCSRPPTCPAAWSTSSPARATRWRRCWPSTTTSTRCGTSAAAEGSAMVERASVGNMKRTWVSYGEPRDWLRPEPGESETSAPGHPGQEHLGAVRRVEN